MPKVATSQAGLSAATGAIATSYIPSGRCGCLLHGTIDGVSIAQRATSWQPKHLEGIFPKKRLAAW